jgi:hypothetical protein
MFLRDSDGLDGMLANAGSGLQYHHTLPIQMETIEPALSITGRENSPPSSFAANDPGLESSSVITGPVVRKPKKNWLMLIIVALAVIFGVWYFSGSEAA